MKNQNTKYSTFTSYLSKTKKNSDIYRLYNPTYALINVYDIEKDTCFYDNYFLRHNLTERNLLTIFSIYCFSSQKINKTEVIKNFPDYLQSILKYNQDCINWKGKDLLLYTKTEWKKIPALTFFQIYNEVIEIQEFRTNKIIIKHTTQWNVSDLPLIR